MKIHMRYGSRFRRLVRSESGAELIEFSLTLPLLLLIVLGILEFGLMFREYEIITNAAREGARIGILPSYQPADITARVNAYLTTAGLNTSLATVTPGAAASETVGTQCISMRPVTVAYTHAVPFLGGIVSFFGGTFAPMTLTATSKMRTETSAGPCP
jgi:Flp pilus assembly protein TadG